MAHGIYVIKNSITGDSYVGRSHNIELRIREHFQQLELGIHCNRLLTESYNRFGISAFEYRFLELLPETLDRSRVERWFCDAENHYTALLRPTLGINRPKSHRVCEDEPLPNWRFSMKKPPKTASGGARLMASGKRPVLLGIPKPEHATISQAAAIDGRPLTQFLVFHGLVAAKKIIGKSQESA